MVFKLLLKLFLIAFAVFLIFLFFANSKDYNPNGFELNISINLLPDVNVYVLDDNMKVMTVIDENEHFYIQQRGLSEGTVYGFRVVDVHSEVIKPVFETYTARDADWVEANNYYLQIRPGNQTIEVLTINESNGIVVARSNITVLNFEAVIMDECGYLMNEPVVDADGWSRETKIGNCTSNIALEIGKVKVCYALSRFNDTGVMFGECLLNYAVTAGDIIACELAGMPKSVGFCKAKLTGDYNQCSNITCDLSCTMESLETQRDLCIQWFAIEHNDSSLCGIIQSDAYNMKEVCFNMTK